MTLIITTLLIALFLACMHQANEMGGHTPIRMIAGLILIMVADVALGLCVINGLFKKLNLIEVAVSLVLVSGIILWLVSERRIGRPVK